MKCKGRQRHKIMFQYSKAILTRLPLVVNLIGVQMGSIKGNKGGGKKIICCLSQREECDTLM